MEQRNPTSRNAKAPTADTGGPTGVANVIDAFERMQFGAADSARTGPVRDSGHPAKSEPPQPDLTKLTDDLLSDTTIMKRARFNAAQRLRKKDEAGQLAFAISGIYGFLVPLFTLQFGDILTPLTANIIGFAAASAGAISFILAMHYQQQRFEQRAEQLHTSGMQLNNMRRALKATHITNAQQLRNFYTHYDAILKLSENHDEIDYAMARSPRTGLGLRSRLFVETYAVCLFIWLAPPLIASAIWVLLS
ncbi:MAG: SLATT domain-containing protein [Pseudomonadota bacterium]